MFYTFPETNLKFSAKFFSSANTFNLDQSKNLLFGKELKTGCSGPLELRIIGIALRRACQCQNNGLVKYWLKNSPGNMDL